jgi:hypothetical protein
VSRRSQRIHQPAADETAGASNQDVHASKEPYTARRA